MRLDIQNESLVITPELLQLYGKDVNIVVPQTFSAIMHKSFYRPSEFLAWSYHYLPLTDKDKKELLEELHIIDTKSFYICDNVENCSFVNNSSYCYNSADISHSREISQSRRVEHSYLVEKSLDVAYSEEIYNSRKCYHSKRVSDSEYIYHSTDIDQCYGILRGNKCKNSTLMFDSENVENCVRSEGNNIKNRILCTKECENYDYALLNREITSRRFEIAFQRINQIIKKYPFEAKESGATPVWQIDIQRMLKDLMQNIVSALGLDKMSQEDKVLLYRLTLSADLLM